MASYNNDYAHVMKGYSHIRIEPIKRTRNLREEFMKAEKERTRSRRKKRDEKLADAIAERLETRMNQIIINCITEINENVDQKLSDHATEMNEKFDQLYFGVSSKKY